jgi:spermidine synthase
MEIESVEVDHEDTPIGRLSLHRYRTDRGVEGYELRIDDRFLMASHGSHSEREMARLARSRFGARRAGLRVLTGGLGAGHTLRATLDLLGVDTVVVAEIGAKVVAWNRSYFADGNGDALDDPRVTVRVADVLEVVASSPDGFDLVLLDVDNGPGWLASPSNAALYDATGLAACRRSLSRGGVLAIWSPQRNPNLERTLQSVFGSFDAADTTPLARAESEPPAVIYLATKP